MIPTIGKSTEYVLELAYLDSESFPDHKYTQHDHVLSPKNFHPSVFTITMFKMCRRPQEQGTALRILWNITDITEFAILVYYGIFRTGI